MAAGRGSAHEKAEIWAGGMCPVRFSSTVTSTDAWLTRTKGLFWFLVLEVSAHGLVLLLWACGRRERERKVGVTRYLGGKRETEGPGSLYLLQGKVPFPSITY